MKLYLQPILFLVLMCSCIYDLETSSVADNTLIIHGLLTNEPQEHIIKVLYSSGFNIASEYVHDAEVSIIDDLGNREILSYKYYGHYITDDNFAGTIGRTYHVEVVLKDGSVYQSDPEQLVNVPEIENLSVSRDDFTIIVSGDFTDNKDSTQYYQWRHIGVYKVYAPKAIKIGLDSCWVKHYDEEFLHIMNDQLINGKSITDYNIANFELNRKFEYGYYLTVKLLSLNQPAYEYLDALSYQINNTGSIFETANYQIRGNVHNSNDSDELVLGYFQVSGQKTKDIYIDQFLGLFGDINCDDGPTYCEDCRLLAANATTEKPDYWPY